MEAFPGFEFGLADERKAMRPASRSQTCRWSAMTARRPSRCRSTAAVDDPPDGQRDGVLRETGGRAVERSLALDIR
jgi:hypothetical protein